MDSINVLLIDDNPADRKLIKLTLEKSIQPVDFVIEMAESLHEGLTYLSTNSFNLVLLDLGLPDSSGLDTVYRIYQAHPETPIVVLTNLSDEEIAVEAIKKGADEYLVKGKFFQERLVRTIRYAIERKRIEEKLITASMQWRSTFDSVKDVIVMYDKDFAVIKVNRAATALFEKPYSKLIGKTHIELFHSWGISESQCPLCQIQKTKKHEEIEVYVSSKNKWFLFSVDPVFDQSDRITGSVAFIKNITEQKKAKEDLERAKKEAEALSEAKSRFLANMSHEIRTPMNAIMGFCELLADEDLTNQQRYYINTICNSGKHLLQVIDDILDLSKIEASKLDIEMNESSLIDLLATIESMMTPLIAEKDLKFEIRADSDLPANIYTDSIRLSQCLINLVNNAIKFTEKGHVYLNVSLENRKDQPYIHFDIEDTGIGIAIDKQKVIFESFTQADSNTTRKFGGTGLGLAITKRLAELMGGKLTLTSIEGKGSTFSLVMPVGLNVTKSSFLDKTNITECVDSSKKELAKANFYGHVLVAEDVKTNQILTKILLNQMGLEVTIAEDGNDAVKKALTQKFDLILMDMHMPNMNGYEATETLRKESLRTPVVALTAAAFTDDKKKCIEAGCNDYLFKPIDRQQLLEKLRKYLPLREQNLIGTFNSITS